VKLVHVSIDWLIRFIKQRAKESWENSKRVHKKGFSTGEGKIRLVIAVFLLLPFSWQLFATEWKIGLSFLFAGSMAIYAGYIYKGREVLGYVLVGVALATVIPSLLPSISESYKNTDYIGMLILILVGVLIWYLSSQLRKGETPTFEGRKAIKRRPRKRRK